MLSLVANYKHRGWRWPLRDGDEVEVWEDSRMLGRIPVALLTQLLLHHLTAVTLEARLRQELGAPPLLPDREPARPPLRAVNGRRLRGRP